MFWILVSICLALFVHFILISPFKFWKKRGVPQGSVWFYWKNTLKSLDGRRTTAEMVQEVYNCFPDKRYIGIYQFHVPSLFIRDPDLIKQVTVKDFDHFVDHNLVAIEEPLWQRNLLGLRGEKWKEMRATLSPSFTSSKMKMMFGLMCECAEQFVDYFLKKNEDIITLEMKESLSRYTNDIIASTAFGIKCDSLKDPENEFYTKGRKATDIGGIKFLMVFLFPRVAKLLGLKFFSDDIRNFFTKVIKDTLEVREREGIVRLDMLHLLMQARKGKLKDESTNIEFTPEEIEKYKKLTDEDIVANALIFFLAGFESVSSEMSFACYELALNPDAQTRLQNEIDETLHNCQGKLTYDSLMKMKYLDMVVLETLRKWPILVVTDRYCVKPCVIEPVLPGEQPVYVKEGDVVGIPIYAIQRDPQFYPDPDRFDPERFSEENKSNINPYTYLTFGMGPRGCIGNRFALMEIKTLLCYILSKFDIVVVDKTPIPIRLSKNPVNLTSRDGFWLGLKKRTNVKTK